MSGSAFRALVTVALAAGALLPVVGLAIACAQADLEGGQIWWHQRAFVLAAVASLKQGVATAALAFALGWPLGVLLGAGGRAVRALAALGALIAWLVPPFLWAIGWSFLRSSFPYRHQSWFDGFSGAVLANLTLQLPLVMVAVALTLRLVGPAAWEAARLAGGPRCCWRLALRSAWAPALGAALLGSLVCLGDAGVGQIMGHHGLAGEVFVALATRLDLREASAKALLGFALILPLASLALWCWWRPLGHWRLLARGASAALRPLPIAPAWSALPIAVLAGLLLAPAAGLLLPLWRARSAPFLAEAFHRLAASLPATLTYGVAAGAIAVAGGLTIAALLASPGAPRHWAKVLLLAWIAIPSSVQALGWLSLGKQTPAFSPLLDSEWSVGALLGWRLAPLAAFVLAAPLESLPRSWLDRRTLDGLGWSRFGWHVLLPQLGPWIGAVFAGTAVLALADVTSLMLLQPPGGASFTSHLFAVMDNSSELVVASLCVALAALAAPWALLATFAWSLRATP